MVNVYWGESTDNVQVTGYYLQQLIGGTWTTIRTVGPGERFQTVSGLAAGTAYQFAAIAFDARGNQSPRADPGTVTTLATTATPTCRVQTILFSPELLDLGHGDQHHDGDAERLDRPVHPAGHDVGQRGQRHRDPQRRRRELSPRPSGSPPSRRAGRPRSACSGSGTPFSPPNGFTLNGTALHRRLTSGTARGAPSIGRSPTNAVGRRAG